jgi:SAM-dependent methyltransferase
VGDLAGEVDVVLALLVVHELPDAARFFSEARAALAPGGTIVLVEPRGHVSAAAFEAELAAAERAGLRRGPGPSVWRSRSAVLRAA